MILSVQLAILRCVYNEYASTTGNFMLSLISALAENLPDGSKESSPSGHSRSETEMEKKGIMVVRGWKTTREEI